MARIYITYGLTLFSAYLVFWIYGLFLTVSAGSTWLPDSAWLASIVHFGISSWLFLFFPKTGRILAILSAIVISIWPAVALLHPGPQDGLLEILIFLIPIISSLIVIYNHIRSFKQHHKPALQTRIILSAIPLGLFIAYATYFLTLIKSGQVTI
jgi:hypothetical protein